MFIARSTPTYVAAYLALAIPTYILPYFGSNSTLVNAFSAALGMGPTPQWWAHAWFLAMLAVLAWLRGGVVGKAYLPVFPVLAAVFDMTPGLSVIPLVPTVMHLAGVIVGAAGKPVTASDADTQVTSAMQLAVPRRGAIAAGLATVLAVGGSLLFVSSAKRTATPGLQQAKQAPETKPPVAAEGPKPLATGPGKPATRQVPVSGPVAHTPPPKPPQRHPAAKPAAAQQQPATKAPPEQVTQVTPEKPTVRYIRLQD